MSKKTNQFEFFEDQRRTFVNEIISFFHDERGEQIGVVAAEAVLDFMIGLIGKPIYETGIGDARKIIKDRLEDMNIELDALLN